MFQKKSSVLELLSFYKLVTCFCVLYPVIATGKILPGNYTIKPYGTSGKILNISSRNTDNHFPSDQSDFSGTPGQIFRGLLPFTKTGTCQRGRTYHITQGEDLLNLDRELECVFFSGISPSKIPLGPLHGTVISILNMEQFSPIVTMVWWGKLLTEMPCHDNHGRAVYIGWNNLLSHFVVPFISKIAPIEENLPPGEFNDGKPNLIIDYSQDFSKMCDIETEDANQSPDRNYIDVDENSDYVYDFSQEGAGAVTNVYPLNQIVDALRLVGVQSDGGRIYLGKSYLRDPFQWSSTVLYFYFVNYDLTVNPNFPKLAQLPPLETSFSYSIPGLGYLDFL